MRISLGGQSRKFLSTPSARRATDDHQLDSSAHGISIHALREEGDANKTPKGVLRYISIHALREEGDSVPRPPPRPVMYFYPRPPRGGRLR